MDYEITYNDPTALFSVKTHDKMSAGDFIAMGKDLLRHSQYVPGGNVLFDHTDLDFSAVPVDDLQAIRAFHMVNEERIGSGKSAVVVKPGHGREWYKLWSQGEKIKTENKEQVFESVDDAMDWLAS